MDYEFLVKNTKTAILEKQTTVQSCNICTQQTLSHAKMSVLVNHTHAEGAIKL